MLTPEYIFWFTSNPWVLSFWRTASMFFALNFLYSSVMKLSWTLNSESPSFFVISCHQHFPILFKNDDEQIYLKFALCFLFFCEVLPLASACLPVKTVLVLLKDSWKELWLKDADVPCPSSASSPSQLLPPYFLEWTILDKYICNGPLPSSPLLCSNWQISW